MSRRLRFVSLTSDQHQVINDAYQHGEKQVSGQDGEGRQPRHVVSHIKKTATVVSGYAVH
ncbi:hypothetical protein LG290_08035 [Halomonas sediminis]